MELTYKQRLIYDGLLCPYCGNNPVLIKCSSFYKRKIKGWMYICRPCNATVGCHGNTQKSKGRLSKPKLKKLKIEAHSFFDQIWNGNKRNPMMSRTDAYKLLSDKLGIPYKYTHIGYFGEETCKKVIEICKTVLNVNRQV